MARAQVILETGNYQEKYLMDLPEDSPEELVQVAKEIFLSSGAEVVTILSAYRSVMIPGCSPPDDFPTPDCGIGVRPVGPKSRSGEDRIPFNLP